MCYRFRIICACFPISLYHVITYLFAYHLPTICLSFAYRLSAYHLPSIVLPFAYHVLMICLPLLIICLPFGHHLPTICLAFSHQVSIICSAFAYHLASTSPSFAHNLLMICLPLPIMRMDLWSQGGRGGLLIGGIATRGPPLMWAKKSNPVVKVHMKNRNVFCGP